MMGKALFDFTASIVPPEHRTTVWRVLITLIIAGHVAWACGWVPGVSGFAMADEVSDVKEDVKTIQIDLVDAQIFEQRLRQCQSTDQARQVHAQRLQRLLRRYQELTGRNYQLPSCSDL